MLFGKEFSEVEWINIAMNTLGKIQVCSSLYWENWKNGRVSIVWVASTEQASPTERNYSSVERSSQNWQQTGHLRQGTYVRTSDGSEFILAHWRRHCWPVPQGRQPTFPEWSPLGVRSLFTLSSLHISCSCSLWQKIFCFHFVYNCHK